MGRIGAARRTPVFHIPSDRVRSIVGRTCVSSWPSLPSFLEFFQGCPHDLLVGVGRTESLASEETAELWSRQLPFGRERDNELGPGRLQRCLSRSGRELSFGSSGKRDLLPVERLDQLPGLRGYELPRFQNSLDELLGWVRYSNRLPHSVRNDLAFLHHV